MLDWNIHCHLLILRPFALMTVQKYCPKAETVIALKHTTTRDANTAPNRIDQFCLAESSAGVPFNEL